MLGEAAILWQLTIQPEKGFPAKSGGSVPAYVYLVIGGALLFGVWRILESIWTIREARREPEPDVRVPRLQAVLWCLLMAGACSTMILWTNRWWIGLCLLLVAFLLPRGIKPPADDWDTKAVAQQQKEGSGAHGSATNPKSE
jgi:hypothetical protein